MLILIIIILMLVVFFISLRKICDAIIKKNRDVGIDRQWEKVAKEKGYISPAEMPRKEEYQRVGATKTFEKAVDILPFLKLCSEIGNDEENHYISFEPPISVEIDYNDYEGKKTHRQVDIRYMAQSDYNDEYYFKGFCLLRDEDRTFKLNRVLKTTVEGREVDLIRYIVDAYRKTDAYKKSVMDIKVREMLNSDSQMGHCAGILTYIARIDGIFTRKEKTVIAHFLKTMADTNDEDDIEIEDYIKGLDSLTPKTSEYKNLVKKAAISEEFIKKAEEITGKDPLRKGAFEILLNQYKKPKIHIKN